MSDSGFASTCEVAVTNTYNTTGTVTRAKLNVLSPSAIAGLFTSGGKWNELNSLLKHQIEMKACGIRRSNLYDWLFSSNKRGMGTLVNVQNISRGASLIEPFIRGLQKSMWNVDHWKLIGNVAYNDSAADDFLADATTSGNRVITVQSSFSGTMTLHADYFIPGRRIHLLSRGTGSALRITQFKIVQAAVHSSGTYENVAIDVEVKLDQPPKTAVTPGDAVVSIDADATASSGIIFLGVNNVHDVEAFCRNRVNVNLNKLVPFWYQTIREARKVSEKYEEIMGKLMQDNAYYTLFGDLPLAERNRQDESRARVEEMNAFFFGERISINQTLDKWGSLDQIKTVTGASVDPGGGDDFMAFRANMIGVIPQLADCNRVTDVAGEAFGLKSFLEDDIYDIVRARRSQGRPADSIDIWTDEASALEFQAAYMAYSKSVVGDVARIQVPSEGLTSWGFPFKSFRLYKPVGVTVNLITDDYFNDLASASSAAEGPGRWLNVLDLGAGGSIYPAILASNRKQYRTGDINDLAKIDKTYACVMENPAERVTLTSKTMTAIVECPLNSLVVANYGSITSGVVAP